MTKKELVKRLEERPVRVIIDGKLRQLTRKAANSEQKAKYKSLDEGSNIGVWDMGIAGITTITAKSVETMIGYGLNTEPSGGTVEPVTDGDIGDPQSGENAGVKSE